MILSVSRRTDIPAYYSAWFLNRLAEGFVLVPNPHNPRQLSRIPLSPETVDCIVFWTKNPTPMLDALPRIEAAGLPVLFPVHADPLRAADGTRPAPKEELVRAFWALSRRLGPKRVVWRYDPVMVDGRYPTAWHLERFEALCGALEGAAERCVFSFVDPYRHTGGAYREMTRSECLDVAGGFGEIAARHGFSLFTCAETIDLSAFGIGHAACIDRSLWAGSSAAPSRPRRTPASAPPAAAAKASTSARTTPAPAAAPTATPRPAGPPPCGARRAHDPADPMLTGWPRGGERISDRAAKSLKTAQTTFY